MLMNPRFIRAIVPVYLSLWFVVGASTVAAQDAPAAKKVDQSMPDLDKAAQWLEEGRSTLDAGPLTAAQQAYEGYANTGTVTFNCCFNLARVYYYMTFMYELNKHRDDAKRSLDTGLKWGLRASGINNQSPEVHALLADMYVRKILVGDFFTPMDCGPKGGAEKDKAVKLGPDNPRVLAMQGRCSLFAPPIFGGDVHKALTYFKKSLELEPGSDETYFWLAKAYRNLNDHSDFEKAIQAALKLNPKNILAQMELESWPVKPAK